MNFAVEGSSVARCRAGRRGFIAGLVLGEIIFPGP